MNADSADVAWDLAEASRLSKTPGRQAKGSVLGSIQSASASSADKNHHLRPNISCVICGEAMA
jgi:hypothetical protein